MIAIYIVCGFGLGLLFGELACLVLLNREIKKWTIEPWKEDKR